METEIEKLRRENSMLKEKLKKKNANKSMYVAQKNRELEKREKREGENEKRQKKQQEKT